MDSAIKQDQNKLRLFKKLGYDIPQARRFVFAKAGLKPGRILEVGTGRGHMAAALARKGLRLISIDLDKKQQRAAQANLRACGCSGSVRMKLMDAEKLRFKDNFFDTVISVNFLHHARDPLRCVQEMARVTKDKLVISDLNKKGERIMARVHALEGNTHPQGGISIAKLRAFLIKRGFRVAWYRNSCENILVCTKNPFLGSPGKHAPGKTRQQSGKE